MSQIDNSIFIPITIWILKISLLWVHNFCLRLDHTWWWLNVKNFRLTHFSLHLVEHVLHILNFLLHHSQMAFIFLPLTIHFILEKFLLLLKFTLLLLSNVIGHLTSGFQTPRLCLFIINSSHPHAIILPFFELFLIVMNINWFVGVFTFISNDIWLMNFLSCFLIGIGIFIIKFMDRIVNNENIFRAWLLGLLLLKIVLLLSFESWHVLNYIITPTTLEKELSLVKNFKLTTDRGNGLDFWKF